MFYFDLHSKSQPSHGISIDSIPTQGCKKYLEKQNLSFHSQVKQLGTSIYFELYLAYVKVIDAAQSRIEKYMIVQSRFSQAVQDVFLMAPSTNWLNA